MIPSTPLNRYILVVVGEEPRSRAAMISPVFDKEERDNDIIGSVTTLGGMTDLSPAILFERIGEISSALGQMDYSQESPVASTYVGDTPVSFQVLPESYGVTQDSDETEVEEAPQSDDFLRAFHSGDIGIALRIGDRSGVMSGAAADMVALLSDPAAALPLVLAQAEYLVLTNPAAAGLAQALVDQGVGDPEDADPEDDTEEYVDYIIALPRDVGSDIVIEILDSVENIDVSKLGDDDDYSGYRVTIPADEKIEAIAAILDISPEITISAA